MSMDVNDADYPFVFEPYPKVGVRNDPAVVIVVDQDVAGNEFCSNKHLLYSVLVERDGSGSDVERSSASQTVEIKVGFTPSISHEQ